MARTVTDAAICLGALTDSDTLDNKTLAADRMGYTDYTQFLKIAAMFKLSQEEGIDKVMNKHNLDAIIAPPGKRI